MLAPTAATVFSLVTGTEPVGGMAPVELPPVRMLRWSEDYSALDPEMLRGLDRLKQLRLADDNTSSLALGGSIREQAESYRNRAFGFDDGDDDAYLLHRIYLHADGRWNDRLRTFVEIGSEFIAWREVEPSPVDENELFVHQAFVDVGLELPDQTETRLRLGRQEMPFGSARMIALRDGPNNRLSFDAIRATLSTNAWSFDAFVARSVELRPGVFDDRINDSTTLWGLYTTIHAGENRPSLDLYYIGIDRDERRFGGASGDELRHSLGVRFFGRTGAFDYNLETVYQFGTLGEADIQAWTGASDIGYTWHKHPWKPRLGLRANIQSGARGGSGTTEIFDPLFPNNAYFSEAATLFPANLTDLNPTFRVSPAESIEIEILWDFVWLTSSSDSAYGPPGAPLFGPAESNGRFVGHSISVRATKRIGRGLTVNAAYTRFEAGNAVRSAGGDDLDYLAGWVEYKF